MNINIHFLAILVVNIFFSLPIVAQDTTQQHLVVTPNNGYYQSINLDNESPCNCNAKTQRTFDLAKGLRPNDVLNYKLHAYKFTLGSSTNSVSKLFKAFEKDNSIYKISMKEWDSFLLLTNENFDVASFEQAAKSVFTFFEPMSALDFLKSKNLIAFNELIKYNQENNETQIK
jgi:hypothetical protein